MIGALRCIRNEEYKNRNGISKRFGGFEKPATETQRWHDHDAVYDLVDRFTRLRRKGPRVIHGLAGIYNHLFPIGKETDLFFRDIFANVSSEESEVPHLIDVGCGTGAMMRIALDYGWTCAGIDPDPDMLKKAGEQFGGDPRVSLLAETMDCDLGKESAHVIICTGNTLCFSASDENLIHVLQSFADALKPGGTLIIQTVNWDRIADRIPFEFPSLEAGGLRFERKYFPAKNRDKVVFETRLWSERESSRETAEMLIVKRDFLAASLVKAGLSDRAFFGDFAKSPWKPDSSLTLALARKDP